MLAKQPMEREEELNKLNDKRIRFVENGGRNIDSILAKKDPFEKGICAEKLCPLCNDSAHKKNISCNTNNVGYRSTCKICKDSKKTVVCEGEASRSARLGDTLCEAELCLS
jgi:hypothetical protein